MKAVGSQGQGHVPWSGCAGASSTGCGSDGCAIASREWDRALCLPGSQDLVCPCSAPDTSGYCLLLTHKVQGTDIQLCFSF